MPRNNHGEFHWNELLTPDPEAAVEFFSRTIDWVFEPVEMQGDGPARTYWIARTGEKAICGIMQIAGVAPEGAEAHWVSYLEVDDVDKRIRTAERAGAMILRPPFDVPGVGRIAMLQDPTGALMGWITPAH